MPEIELHYLPFTLRKIIIEFRLTNHLIILTFSDFRAFDMLHIPSTVTVIIRNAIIVTKAAINDAAGPEKVKIANVWQRPCIFLIEGLKLFRKECFTIE